MKNSLIILVTLTLFQANAQMSVSFSHLGNTTFQNSYINPALIPEGKIFVGLPGLSGIHVQINNKVSYNETFTKKEGKTIVDIDKILPNLQNQNVLSAHSNINLLHLGVKIKSGAIISLIANERIEGDALYSKQGIQYLWNGNSTFVNEEVDLGKSGLRVSHFREIGLGIAIPVNKQLNVGLRGKFLTGFLNISTPGNMRAKIISYDEAFRFDVDRENVALRSSGRKIYFGGDGSENSLATHLTSTDNIGFGIDLGATYDINSSYTITGSLLDIGFINWKKNIVNRRSVNDNAFTYKGINIANVSDVRAQIEDSLFSQFKTTENSDPYISWLPIKAYGSWIYHHNEKTDFHFTTGTRFIQRQFKMIYGAGITYKFEKVLTGSVSVTKLPQQFLNLGVALALKGGPVQIYLAADQIANLSVPDIKSLDLQFGMNFVFGKKDESAGTFDSSRSTKGSTTRLFLGSLIKTKKTEGIYAIIAKQKRRKIKIKERKRAKVRKKSLTGRSPSDNRSPSGKNKR